MLLKKKFILGNVVYKRVLRKNIHNFLCDYCRLWMKYSQCPSIKIGILCDNLNVNLHKFSYIVI